MLGESRELSLSEFENNILKPFSMGPKHLVDIGAFIFTW
jgi:hypothetical protein